MDPFIPTLEDEEAFLSALMDSRRSAGRRQSTSSLEEIEGLIEAQQAKVDTLRLAASG